MIRAKLHWAESCAEVSTPARVALCGFAACSSLSVRYSEAGLFWGLLHQRCKGRRGRGKKLSAPFENQKQMFWVFWRRGNCYVVSRELGFEEVKRWQSCWVQIKITVRRKEQLLRETGWHAERWGSASHTPQHISLSWCSSTAGVCMSMCHHVSRFVSALQLNMCGNRFTLSTSWAEPGVRTPTSPIHPITVGPLETPAQQGAVGAKMTFITAWPKRNRIERKEV